jgi:RNA polymerase sigma-70 factor, ECF subfamily
METDEVLFERLVRGDMRAFDRLYERFERQLFGFIRAQLGDVGEAEDVLHEAFMAVLRERDKRSEVRSFRSWLYQVAHNLCLNRVRSRKRAAGLVEESKHVKGSDPPGAHEALEGQERAKLLERAVERLPKNLGEVYRLRAAGMSLEEVAEILAVPIGTVKSRMHEMVKRLREEVQT